MPISIRGLLLAASAASMILFCSCEKHHLGEDAEVQTEKVDLTKDAKPAAESTPQGQPTPAEFFSPAKKTP